MIRPLSIPAKQSNYQLPRQTNTHYQCHQKPWNLEAQGFHPQKTWFLPKFSCRFGGAYLLPPAVPSGPPLPQLTLRGNLFVGSLVSGVEALFGPREGRSAVVQKNVRLVSYLIVHYYCFASLVLLVFSCVLMCFCIFSRSVFKSRVLKINLTWQYAACCFVFYVLKLCSTRHFNRWSPFITSFLGVITQSLHKKRNQKKKVSAKKTPWKPPGAKTRAIRSCSVSKRSSRELKWFLPKAPWLRGLCGVLYQQKSDQVGLLWKNNLLSFLHVFLKVALTSSQSRLD